MTLDVAANGRLILEGAQTIRTADAVRETLRETLMQHPGVAIDCSGVTEADLSLIQLLIAARSSARMSLKTLALAARPEGALLDTLTRGGFRVAEENQSGSETAFWFEGASA